RTDMKVVLLWGPGEYEADNKIKNDMKTTPIIAPPTDLRQAAALLKVCRLLICNNCGMNHLSATTRTPTVAIFRKEHTVWSPGLAFNHFHLCRHDLCPEDDSTFGFSPEDVFEEVKKVLNMNLSR
ncbi:MAG: glycosyltransferase family 9 protein, partial [Fibrobacter sp.]|nr:glycosyltransferase family 9 protein [Fibrobacter sp.]